MSLADLALIGAIKAFAKGRRWRVICATCGDTHIVSEVRELGRALLDHAHDGDVNLTIQSGTRTGP